ncbi:MAG: helix-turn-helix transcriptional regulator [Serpentinimonas sp.]|nr:helix-turn-helix transcriptional regulator [Serpentinimonas sp.]MDO9612375.1 helix-turn-helix transcriptional regulator [Serpentinimonas sp.]
MEAPQPQTGLQTAASLAEFGELFRRERKALGMTQSDVAKKANCRRQTIADIEAGKSVTTLTFFNAILSIQKQVQLCSLGLDLENVRAFLGPDWEN